VNLSDRSASVKPATVQHDRPDPDGEPRHSGLQEAVPMNVSIEPLAHTHLDGLIALVAAEGWTEYTEDPERTHRALSAPGVTALVALAEGRVVGAIQVQSDGVIQAHVSMLLIDPEWRGHRLGSRLLREALERAGGLRIDIRTRTEGYYERLGASRSLGFRLTREALGISP
jgi:ribosomal protein S18 acetylase RimI-like enzyme